MQIFGIDLWRILLAVILIILVVKRANIVASFAKTQFAKGNYEKAIKIFKVADVIGNLNVNNKSFYGYALLRSGDPESAQVVLRGILPYTKEKTADRYQIKNLLALTYWKLGNLEDAIEELEEVVEQDYKTTVVYQNLGLLYNLSDDREKALAFNLEAYEYNSDDNIILDNLAEAYAKSGDFEKAIEYYEKLLEGEKEPHFPEAYWGYGEVLIKRGQKDKGIEMIEKSLTKKFTYLSTKTKEQVEEMLSQYK